MKILSILFLIINLTIGDCRSISNSQQRLSTNEKIIQLNNYYQQWVSKPTNAEIQKSFFYYFPNSFPELDSIYGYEKNNPSPLYDKAENHIIKLFNNISLVDEKLYYSKLINISINGHWDADGINYFQSGMKDRVLKNPALITQLLSIKTDSEIESFWFFFFDNPQPKQIIPIELKTIAIKNKRIYTLLEKGLKRACKK